MSRMQNNLYIGKKFKGIGIMFNSDYLGVDHLGYPSMYYFFEFRFLFIAFWIKIKKK